jgi:membrane dipeptidase
MTGDEDADMTGLPIVDGHADAILRCYDGISSGRGFLERDENGHLDLRRARDGGIDVVTLATFVPNGAAGTLGSTPDDEPASELDPGVARRETFDMLALPHRWARESDAFRIVETTADLDDCVDGERLGAVLHLEGAGAVAPDCSNLDLLYAAGVRSIGPVWSRPNAFGHGVPLVHDRTPDIGPGLTEAGERLVRACNDRGIVLDCAHMTAAGLADTDRVSDDPIVVSHGGAHAVSPSARNYTDDQIETVAASEVVIGITLATTQLRPDGADDPDTPVSLVADHVEHVVDVAGVDSVALGTDFDGATIPSAVGDAAGLGVVLDALRDRGFDGEDLAAIVGGNWRRVYEATWGE